MADYATTLPIESLTGSEQRKGSDATPDLVRLPGARFVRASEPEQGQQMKEALIKAMTGGEAMLIRRMMQEFVEIVPEFKLTISGNHKPYVRGSDDGIWRRILLVPWNVQIPEEETDLMLPQKLWAERAGIFRWMVEGCLEWMETGLRIPNAITVATEEYRRDSDVMGTFLKEECEISGDADTWVSTKDLVEAFNAWMMENQYSAWARLRTTKEIRKQSENMKGRPGAEFFYLKRSISGYQGISISAAAMERVEKYSIQLLALK